MKNFLIIITILFLSNLNYGQVAIIKDDDGFTNVRKIPSIDSEIIYRLKDSEVFSYRKPKAESHSDWITVYISKNKYQLESGEDDTLLGYIHKSRLCPIEDLAVYQGTEFSFEYKLQKFNPNNKILDYEGKWIAMINGRRYYGTDGDMPYIEVSGIDASINGEKINIPSVLYEDIFQCNNTFVINKNKEDYIVHQWNSDGAGGYFIVWVIDKEKVKQRLILMP